MLATQVQYWNYKEGQRHNLVSEKQQDFIMREGQRHNLISENQNQQSINETVRHNLAYESIQRDTLNESIRHNKVSESLGWSNYHEAVRHNVATESNQRLQARASLISAEAARSQATTAFLNYGSQSSLRSAQTSQARANTAKTKKETGYLAQENVRSWISTVTSGLKSVSDAASNFVGRGKR